MEDGNLLSAIDSSFVTDRIHDILPYTDTDDEPMYVCKICKDIHFHTNNDGASFYCDECWKRKLLQNTKVVLKLVLIGGKDADPLRAKVKLKTSWRKVFCAFCEYKGQKLEFLNFLYNGQTIKSNQTIGDIIDVKDYVSDDIQINVYCLVKTMVLMRENTGWDLWKKALFEKTGRLCKSTHKWSLKPETTFADIRIKLGKYYDLDAVNIEVWIQVLSQDKKELVWDYTSKGRGGWHTTIGDIMAKEIGVTKYFYMKFEIVLYNVLQLEAIVQSQQNSDKMKQFALYNLSIHTPNHNGLETIPLMTMTVIHKRNWKARQLICKILQHVNNNPLYGFVYFSTILEYIQKNESAISLLQKLKPNQFVICEDQLDKTPNTWRMNQIYRMRKKNKFLPLMINKTKLRLQFLDKNDPFVMKSKYKPLWVLFEWDELNVLNIIPRNNQCCRIVIHHNDTFRDIVTNQILKHINSFNKESNRNNKLSFENIMRMCQFKLRLPGNTNYKVLEPNVTIYDIITSKSRLLVQVMTAQNVQMSAIKTQSLTYSESELTLSTIERIGSDCSYFGYDAIKISHCWDVDTIQNAVDWMSKIKINSVQSYQSFSRILLAKIVVDLEISTYMSAMPKLRNMLLETSIAIWGNVDYAVRVGYAFYVCMTAAFFLTDPVVQKNIIYFHIWLVKHRYLSGISNLYSFAILEFENLQINVNETKYIVKSLWKCFDVIKEHLNKDEQIGSADSRLDILKDIIASTRHCYVYMLKMNVNDINIKMCRKIYRINDKTIQLKLLKIVYFPMTMRAMPKQITNKDEYGYTEFFKTQNKVLWLKQMVRGIHCAWCNKQDTQLKCCKGCKSVWHCSRKHQKFHWTEHHCN